MQLRYLTPGGLRVARHQSLTLYGVADQAVPAAVAPQLAEIARLARLVTASDGAAVNILPPGRQITLAATAATSPDEIAEGVSICAVLLEQRPRGVVVVPDLTADHRFARNPFVDGTRAAVRGYASAPLIGSERVAIGTVCVYTWEPRTFDRDQAALLEQLANATVKILDDARRQLRPSAVALRPGMVVRVA